MEVFRRFSLLANKGVWQVPIVKFCDDADFMKNLSIQVEVMLNGSLPVSSRFAAFLCTPTY